MSRRWIPRRWNLRFVRAYFSQAKFLTPTVLAAATIFRCAGRPAFWPAHPPPEANNPQYNWGLNIWPANLDCRQTSLLAGYPFAGYSMGARIFFRIGIMSSFPRRACPERKPNGRESTFPARHEAGATSHEIRTGRPSGKNFDLICEDIPTIL